MDEVDEAYQQGEIAGRGRGSIDDNPHIFGSYQWVAWRGGWFDSVRKAVMDQTSASRAYLHKIGD